MSLVLDDDDYPPYAKEAPRVYNDEKSVFDPTIVYGRNDVAVFIVAGLVAGVAIGGLLVAYGVLCETHGHLYGHNACIFCGKVKPTEPNLCTTCDSQRFTQLCERDDCPGRDRDVEAIEASKKRARGE